MIGYKQRINNKNDTKCMDTYLRGALESELVITKLGPVKDYLPVDAPLLDYTYYRYRGTYRAEVS